MVASPETSMAQIELNELGAVVNELETEVRFLFEKTDGYRYTPVDKMEKTPGLQQALPAIPPYFDQLRSNRLRLETISRSLNELRRSLAL
jgi:hypothetical protein